MLKIWDATNFRRTFTGLALLAAPLTDLAAALFYPRFPGDPNGDMTIIAEHPNRFLIASMLHILASVLFVPAIVGIMNLLRERGVMLAHLGGGLAVLGFLGRLAFTSLGLMQLPLAAHPDRAQALTLGEQAMSSPPFMIFLLTFLTGISLGLVLLAIAVWRSRVTPWWIALCFVLALVMDQFGPAGIGFLLTTGLMVIGFGYIGLKVLRMSDEAWEHPRLSHADVQLHPATS